MYLEVEENPNCEDSVSMRFKDLGPPRTIRKVRIEGRAEGTEWCWVIGWCDDPEHPVCPAYAQKVEESGMGRAFLIFGGNHGIRLKPVRLEEDWDLESRNQWGEAFLLLGDPTSFV